MSFIKNLFSSPDPPTPVDPNALLRQQGALNEETARLNAKLNRVDTYSPFGSVTFEDLGDDRWRSVQTLSPEMQSLQDTQLATGQGVSDAALTKVGQLPTGAFSLDGVPGYQGAIDYSGLTEIPGTSDFDRARTDAEDAAFNRVWDRLGTQFDDERTALETRLANQGIDQSSEMWGREFDRYNERLNDARTAAAYDAVTAGQSMFNNLFANALTARQQGISERTGDLNLANQARAQEIGDMLLERGQPINELAAFLQGSPAIQLPQQQGAAGVNVAAPDVGGAYGLAAQQQSNNYAQQVAQQNAGLSGLFNLGSAYILGG